MIRTVFIGLAIVFLSCTSTSLIEGDAPETTSDFDVDLRQLNNPPIQGPTRSIDVKFEVAVTNRTSEPVTVEHISLESFGAGDYAVPFRSRPFHRSLAPGPRKNSSSGLRHASGMR